MYFFNQGYHWIELNEYTNISKKVRVVHVRKNFGARPKLFSISKSEVLKQFLLIDETISHKYAAA